VIIFGIFGGWNFVVVKFSLSFIFFDAGTQRHKTGHRYGGRVRKRVRERERKMVKEQKKKQKRRQHLFIHSFYFTRNITFFHPPSPLWFDSLANPTNTKNNKNPIAIEFESNLLYNEVDSDVGSDCDCKVSTVRFAVCLVDFHSHSHSLSLFDYLLLFYFCAGS